MKKKPIKQIVSEALDKRGPDRESYLNEVCGNDLELKEKVKSTLAVHEESGVLSESSPFDADATLEESPLVQKPGTVIGRYKLLEQIGEGGMAVVYMAEQQKVIHRKVALKLIKPGMDSKQVIARFEAERQALAMMDHPNIAKVLDAGATDMGRPYFVMELVRGIPITQYCDQEKLNTRARLELFIEVCHAIQHAHQKGIIHRDIKPSNVMITMHDGNPVPKVIDFGIAKATNQRLTEKTLFTRYAHMIGTPEYMSPEQAEMSGLDIDTRSDIYSLGVLLYELLTGRTPFDTDKLRQGGVDDMRRVIRETEPPKPSTKVATLEQEDRSTTAVRHAEEPSKLISLLKGDLDWIVMKCLEKDRTRRYETANALAMDIERYFNNEPVIARSPSFVYRVQKAWRRNKVVHTAAMLVMVSLVAGIAMSLWQARRAQINEHKAITAQADEKLQRQRADAARAEAQAQAFIARQRAYASDMNVAKQALDDHNLGRALDLLNRQRPQPGQQDLRGWEWRYLWQQTRSDALFTLCRQPSEINSLAISLDGNWLAFSVFHKGDVSVWDLRTRKEVTRLTTTELVVAVDFSPTESVLAFASETFSASGKQQSTLHLYDMVTRQMMGEFRVDGSCGGLAFSKDGQTLVTSTDTGRIDLWDVHERIKLDSCSSQQGTFYVATTPFAATKDLSLAAYGQPKERISVVDLRNGKEIWNAVASKDLISALAFSPDGKILASAGGFGEMDIRLWDVATGQEIGTLPGHESFISSLVFWPDGKTLASGSGDQTIRIWDVESRTCLDTLRGHLLEVYRLALLPDGKTLVSGSKDGEICLWDTSRTHPRPAHITFPGRYERWCFGPKGQSILTVSQDHITRWTGAEFAQSEVMQLSGVEFEQSELLPAVELNRHKFLFSRDGHYLAVKPSDDIIQIWDLQRNTLRSQLTNSTGSVPWEFFRDENKLITCSIDSLAKWDLIAKRKTNSWNITQSFGMWSFVTGRVSPDAQQLITIGFEGDTLCVNLQDDSTCTLDLNVLEPSGADYSPDGRLFAVSSALGFAKVWDTTTWREQAMLRGYLVGLSSLAFSSDGNRLVTGSDGKEAIRLWDTDSWCDVLTLGAEGTNYYSVAFSPDGNMIGAKSRDGILRIWRAPSIDQITAVEAKQESQRELP